MRQQAISFANKPVHIGIDVHKSKYSLTAVCDRQVVKQATVRANPVEVAKYLKSHFCAASQIATVYEAGFAGFGLHRRLVAEGIDSIIVNPASITVAANDKVKTDKRDSAKMARDLADKRLHGIHIPTEDDEQERLLPRTRTQIVEHRATLSRQIKAKLHLFGHIAPDEKRMLSHRYLRELEARPMPEMLKVCLRLLFDQWRFCTRQLFEVRKLLRAQACRQTHLERIYRSVPGVGETSARILATELGDLSRFPNERAVASFTGLTPAEYSSGDRVRRGCISRQGSARIRQTLVEVAWRAITKDPALNAIFERIAQRRGKKRAIVAIARRLIVRARSCFLHNTTYEIGRYGTRGEEKGSPPASSSFACGARSREELGLRPLRA